MKVFIGSSKEAKEREVVKNLALWIENEACEPVPWDKAGLFPLGAFLFSRLLEIATEVDAAVLVFSEDESVWYRDDLVGLPRDNVLLEYGLFAAVLGPANVIVARENAAKMPSDIAGNIFLPVSLNQHHRAQVELSMWLKRIRGTRAKLFPRIETQMVALRRATGEILNSLDGPEHPIVRFLEAWYGQVVRELLHGGATSFEVDPSYYRSCLEYLNKGRENIYAVADLSVDIESFWKTMRPRDAQVTQRIFLLRPEQFFQDDFLHKLLNVLRPHSAVYSVRVAHVVPGDSDGLPFHQTPGRDMILVEPEILGGYVRSSERLRLRITLNRARYQDGLGLYNSIETRSVPVSSEMTPSQLRAEWMQVNKIGIWRKRWNYGRVADRTPEYFLDYDAHIRAWIQVYEELIRKCGRAVADDLSERLRDVQHEVVRVLEVGFGTGALTAVVLARLEAGDKTRVHYFGVDEAEQRMSQSFRERVNISQELARRFTEGTVYADREWELEQSARRGAPFDVITGSLVLHDLVAGSPRDKFGRLLDRCSGYLKPGGALIFADVFTSVEPAQRDQQERDWLEAMVRNGLAEKHARHFLESNREMLDTINEDTLSELAPKHGYEYKLTRIGPPGSPFQLLLMRKVAQ